jgi:hypothetical protein
MDGQPRTDRRADLDEPSPRGHGTLPALGIGPVSHNLAARRGTNTKNRRHQHETNTVLVPTAGSCSISLTPKVACADPVSFGGPV